MRKLAWTLLVVALSACSRGEEKRASLKPAPRQSGLRLVSYNAWGVPFSRDLFVRFRGLPRALKSLAPDVLCLQEIWLGAQRDGLVSALEEYEFTEGTGGGLVVASRFPILEQRFTPFPVFDGLPLDERLGGKGWLEVTVRVPDGRVRIVTTHLALRGPRGKQLDELLRRLDETRDLPLILAGDFNTACVRNDRIGPAYASVLALGFFDVNPPKRRADGSLNEGPPTRVGWPRPSSRGWRPDYVFHRPASPRRLRHTNYRLALDKPDTALSDHNLLLAEFRFED